MLKWKDRDPIGLIASYSSENTGWLHRISIAHEILHDHVLNMRLAQIAELSIVKEYTGVTLRNLIQHVIAPHPASFYRLNYD